MSCLVSEAENLFFVRIERGKSIAYGRSLTGLFSPLKLADFN